MSKEVGRITFLIERDGMARARDFALRTLAVYRAAMKRGKDGKRTRYAQTYRRALLESCIEFRAFLRATSNGRA